MGRLRLGLADLLGVIVVACVVLVTPLGAPATTARQVALVVGAAALIPAVVHRLRLLGLHGTGAARLILYAVAWGLVVWAGVSAVVHAPDIPWQQEVYGWYGRAGGVLTWAAGAVLLTAATVLRVHGGVRSEVVRMLEWITAAAAVCAAAVVMQIAVPGFLATSDEVGRPGTMGNSNFAGALCGIALVLAVGLAWMRRGGWQSVVWGVTAGLLTAGAVAAGALQGPAAAVLGCVVGGAAAMWLRGSRWVAWVMVGALAVGTVAIVLSVRDVGPLVWVWQEPTMQARVMYWRTALATMEAEPLLGAGPDSFAAAVAQYRPLDYLGIRGPDHYVSAAHSVPLQIGATVGVPGLLLWLGSTVLVTVVGMRAVAHRTGATVLAAVLGAWSAYVAQSLISIDQVGLLAVGCTLTGLVVAVSATPRGAGAAARSHAQKPGTQVVIASCVCAAVALVVCAPAVAATARWSTADPNDVISSPWTPCALRVAAAQRYGASNADAAGLAVLQQGYAIDPNCPGLGLAVARTALTAGQPAVALRVSAEVLDRDPYSTWAWILDGFSRVRTGDVSGARMALEQARALAKYTQGEFGPALDALNREIKRA